MKKVRTIILAALAALSISSCMRDPIVYPVSNYYLVFHFDEIGVPGFANEINQLYNVVFYEKETGKHVSSFFVNPYNHPSDMPLGGYVQGVKAGEYYMVVYGFDSPVTRVNNTESYTGIFTDTEKYGYEKSTPVIYMPHHMLYYRAEVSLPFVTDENRMHFINVRPFSVCENKTIYITGIKNHELIESVTLYVSGQAQGKWLGKEYKPLDGNAVVLLGGTVEKKPAMMLEGDDVIQAGTGDSDDDYVVVGRLVTFGGNPEGDRILLSVFVTAVGGIVTWAQEDITDIVAEAEAEGRSDIFVEVDLEATERPEGGFDPEASPWKDDVTEIELQ